MNICLLIRLTGNILLTDEWDITGTMCLIPLSIGYWRERSGSGSNSKGVSATCFKMKGMEGDKMLVWLLE